MVLLHVSSEKNIEITLESKYVKLKTDKCNLTVYGNDKKNLDRKTGLS